VTLVIPTVYDLLPTQLALSVAVTVKLKFPVCVGVPVRAPLVARFREVGSDPDETANVYGAVPPVAVIV
jgi:hypothetical protein